MVLKLRSRRLSKLFAEVWESLPEADRDLISKRLLLVIDNAIFLPREHPPVLGAAVGVAVKNTVCLIYLSPRRLQRHIDSRVRFVIAHELAHVFLGHVEKFMLSPLSESNDESQEVYEKEADRQAGEWGY